MKIISGSLGGRLLKTAKGGDIRPAMQKTREALFSMLEAGGINWQETRVLDLFAGSGSLAFECLSRGAPWAAMVDNSNLVCRLLAKNRDYFDLNDKCYIYESDVNRFLRHKPQVPFDLVFIDPPYRQNLVQAALFRLDSGGWLTPDVKIIAEVEKDAKIMAPESLELETMRNFGQTYIHIWKKNENSSLSRNI